MNQEMPLAKQEHDKEDILREATALVNRIELRSTDGSWKSTVHVGFRRDQSIAFFFGAEPGGLFLSKGDCDLSRSG